MQEDTERFIMKYDAYQRYKHLLSPSHIDHSYMCSMAIHTMRDGYPWSVLSSFRTIQVLDSCYQLLHEMGKGRVISLHHQVKTNRFHVEGYHLPLQHPLSSDH